MARPGRPQAANAPSYRPATAEESRTEADSRRGWRRGRGSAAGGARAYPRGRASMRQVPCAMPQLRRTPKRGAASSLPPGRPLTGASPLGGAAQRASGAGAGSPDGTPRAAPRDAQAAPKTSRSWLGALAAGIVGGAVAALALSYWALSRDSAQLASLRAQVQGVEQTLAGTEGQSGDVARLTSRLDALERGSGAAVDEKIRGQVEALKAADAALQKRLDAFEPGTAGAQVQDLATRVDQLEAAVAAAGSSGRDERGGDAAARRAGGQAQRPVDHRRTARAGHSRRSAGAGRTDLPHRRARGALRSGRGSEPGGRRPGRPRRRSDAADHRRPGAGRRPERQGRGARQPDGRARHAHGRPGRHGPTAPAAGDGSRRRGAREQRAWP